MNWCDLPDNTRVEVNPRFKNLLRLARGKNNWKDFSDEVGISINTFHNIYYLRYNPNIATLKKLVDTSEISVEDIQDTILWNENLKQLLLPEQSFENCIVNIDGRTFIDIAIFCRGLKIVGKSEFCTFPLLSKSNTNSVSVWYETLGGQRDPKKITVNKLIPLNQEFLEIFGLIQAEGTKQLSYLGFQFSNSDPDNILRVLNYFENFWNISRDLWNVQIYYWNVDFKEKKKWIRNFWCKKLYLDKKRVNVLQGTGYRLSKNASRCGVGSLRLNNKAFSTLILKVLYNIVQPLVETEVEYTGAYLRGLFEGDGTLCTVRNKFAYIGLAFNPKSNEFDHYQSILHNIGIEVESGIKHKKRIILLHGWKKQYILLKLTNRKLFFDERKNTLLQQAFVNNQYVKSIVRLREFAQSLNAIDYAEEFGVVKRTALLTLNRLVKLKFLIVRKQSNRNIYSKTNEYKMFLKLVEGFKYVN